MRLVDNVSGNVACNMDDKMCGNVAVNMSANMA